MGNYICNGYHTRYDNKTKTTTTFKPGDTINPTKFEFASFKNKFKLCEPMLTDDDTEIEDVNYLALNTIKATAMPYVEKAESYDDDAAKAKAVKNLVKAVAMEPDTQEATDKLVRKIETFINTLNG